MSEQQRWNKEKKLFSDFTGSKSRAGIVLPVVRSLLFVEGTGKSILAPNRIFQFVGYVKTHHLNSLPPSWPHSSPVGACLLFSARTIQPCYLDLPRRH